MKPEPSVKTFIIVGHAIPGRAVHEMGKTRQWVQCICGYHNLFYLWSWAGHGYLRCRGCRRRINRKFEVLSEAQIS